MLIFYLRISRLDIRCRQKKARVNRAFLLLNNGLCVEKGGHVGLLGLDHINPGRLGVAPGRSQFLRLFVEHFPAVVGVLIAVIALMIFGQRAFMLPALVIVSGVLIFWNSEQQEV